MTDKPPVVREWEDIAKFVDMGYRPSYEDAAILVAELRSRPTREEYEDAKADAVRRHHNACDLQEKVWALEAKLAASEAQTQKWKDAFVTAEFRLKASEAERERLKNVVAAAYDLWREGDGQSLAMQIALSGALAGKDPTDA